MQPFNWVDIDGIRYSWDGQGYISCAGQFGYQASIAGARLDGIEIENEAGDVAGSLSVDFAGAAINYLPIIDSESTHKVILVGYIDGQQEYQLDHVHSPFYQDLLGQSETIPWSTITSASSSADMEQPVPGQVLSWDSFHFDDEILLGSMATLPEVTDQTRDSGSSITISLDLTNQILDQIPPLHEI